MKHRFVAFLQCALVLGCILALYLAYAVNLLAPLFPELRHPGFIAFFVLMLYTGLISASFSAVLGDITLQKELKGIRIGSGLLFVPLIAFCGTLWNNVVGWQVEANTSLGYFLLLAAVVWFVSAFSALNALYELWKKQEAPKKEPPAQGDLFAHAETADRTG